MSVKIRLARAGARKTPFYRVVVTDSRSPRDGRFIEIVGRYNPRATPSMVELELDRIKEWIAKGATPSETVTKLLAIAEDPEAPPPATAKDSRPSRKVQARDKATSEAPAETPDEVADEEQPAEAEAPASEGDEQPLETGEGADESDETADEPETSDDTVAEPEEEPAEDAAETEE